MKVGIRARVNLMNRIIKNLFLLIIVIIAAKLLIAIFAKDVSPKYPESIVLGAWTVDEIETLMEQGGQKDKAGAKIDFLSESFLETPYAENTLGGSKNHKESLTVNLSGVDCFTYLDYVEALRLSVDFEEFKKKLALVRYKDGQVKWEKRKHFFSDWVTASHINAYDVTRQIGGETAITLTKQLNRKTDGSLWLPGLPVVTREISYIPSEKIDSETLKTVETGDYLGIYSDKDGLDVTHTGIAVRKDDGVYLRHASSIHKKVVDEKLTSYISKKPGLLIYRAN